MLFDVEELHDKFKTAPTCTNLYGLDFFS